MPHPLLASLLDAAEGRFPPDDGGVTYLPALPGGIATVVAFTAHAVVAADVGEAELADLRPDGYGRAHTPEVLLRIAAGRPIGVIDVTLVGRGTCGDALPPAPQWDDHPRAHYARRLRDEVAVHGDDRGLITLSSGLAGRRELSIELTGAFGRGAGRSLIADALTLVPTGEPVFAAVSPGNARSLRAFLSQGFVPIGSEVVIG